MANEVCVCGGTKAKPSPDCERCDLIARIDALESASAEVQRLYAYCIALESGCSPKHVDRARVRSGVNWIPIHTSGAESLLLSNPFTEPTDGK